MSLLRKIFNTKNKAFISDIDIALREFDSNHPKSENQLAEIEKYRQLNKMRDSSTTHQRTTPRTPQFWED